MIDNFNVINEFIEDRYSNKNIAHEKLIKKASLFNKEECNSLLKYLEEGHRCKVPLGGDTKQTPLYLEECKDIIQKRLTAIRRNQIYNEIYDFFSKLDDNQLATTIAEHEKIKKFNWERDVIKFPIEEDVINKIRKERQSIDLLKNIWGNLAYRFIQKIINFIKSIFISEDSKKEYEKDIDLQKIQVVQSTHDNEDSLYDTFNDLKKNIEHVLKDRKEMLESILNNKDQFRYVDRVKEQITKHKQYTKETLIKISNIENGDINKLNELYLETTFYIQSQISQRGSFDPLSDKELSDFYYRGGITEKIKEAKKVDNIEAIKALKKEAMLKSINDANKLTKEVQELKPIVEDKFYTTSDVALSILQLEKPIVSCLKKEKDIKKKAKQKKVMFDKKAIKTQKMELFNERKSNIFYTNELMRKNRQKKFTQKSIKL